MARRGEEEVDRQGRQVGWVHQAQGGRGDQAPVPARQPAQQEVVHPPVENQRRVVVRQGADPGALRHRHREAAGRGAPVPAVAPRQPATPLEAQTGQALAPRHAGVGHS